MRDEIRALVEEPPPGFAGIRWWTPAEVNEAPTGTIEPHLGRMLAKLAATTP
ncbi:hypothetical protein [Micromonospora aurantiaca (nom. illeg.)]|uniref:hypothetical protein n=1 Tax=Micromonospora aurantiaca (nom. illeg.) TaxID=47850 RepID=UPI0033E2BA62